MSKFLYVVIFLTTVFLNGDCSSTNKKCVQENPCLCILNEYSKINISSVVDNHSYLEDTYYNVTHNITYYFLGCEDRIFENEKKLNASSLIKYEETYNTTSNVAYKNYTIIASSSSIKFNFENNNIYLVYNETGNLTPRIQLYCTDASVKKPLLKILNFEFNELILFSPKVCEIIEHSHGLSGGTIFLIILFVLAGIYFFGGALLLYVIRGARDIEMIPNIDFWKNLPGLVKDGVMFLLSGCKPTFVSTAETYDRI